MGRPALKDAAFLFRSDQGVIDAPTWWRAVLPLAGAMILFTVIWRLVAPYAQHDLDTTPLFAPATLLAYLYLLFYSFAVILGAICFYNLSAKRWRSRGRPPGLAALPLLLGLVAGSAHWLQPRVADAMPRGYVTIIDLALLATVVWTIVELGFLPAAPLGPPSSTTK